VDNVSNDRFSAAAEFLVQMAHNSQTLDAHTSIARRAKRNARIKLNASSRALFAMETTIVVTTATSQTTVMKGHARKTSLDVSMANVSTGLQSACPMKFTAVETTRICLTFAVVLSVRWAISLVCQMENVSSTRIDVMVIRSALTGVTN